MAINEDKTMITVCSTVETKITPEMAAEAFSRFDDDEQVAFFAALASQVKANFDKTNVWPYGEMQWCYMADKLKQNKEANAMYHAISSFAFEFSTDNRLIRQRSTI
jgi:hypothetical protein